MAKLEANVPRELARMENNLRAIAARHDSLSKAVEVAEKNVAVVEQSWQQGLASQLEFRTAETDLLATRGGILKAAYQQETTRAEWDRATGRYFQFSDDTDAQRCISSATVEPPPASKQTLWTLLLAGGARFRRYLFSTVRRWPR